MLQQYQDVLKTQKDNASLTRQALFLRAKEPLLAGLRHAHCHLLAGSITSIGSDGTILLHSITSLGLGAWCKTATWSFKYNWNPPNDSGFPGGASTDWSELDLGKLALDGVTGRKALRLDESAILSVHVTTYVRLVREGLSIIKAWANSIRQKTEVDARFFRFSFYYCTTNRMFTGNWWHMRFEDCETRRIATDALKTAAYVHGDRFTPEFIAEKNIMAEEAALKWQQEMFSWY